MGPRYARRYALSGDRAAANRAPCGTGDLMLCDICGKNEASIGVKQATKGEVRELHLCQGCAQAQGIELPSPLGLTDFLFGMEVRATPAAPDQEKACRACGRKASEIQKDTRLGCATCYEVFAEEVAAVIQDVQPSSTHVGKTPASARVRSELAARTRQLQEAVAREDFEEAAKLRDLIRQLKTEPTPT
jgi:protein arginine kinase activator